MDAFKSFLYDNPFGSALKVAIGALLAYVLDNITSFNLPPVVALLVTSLTPVAINYLNDADPRYGKHADAEVADEE